MFADLLLNAIVSGILLGAFYAAVAVGLAISFGMLDIGNLAHPAFVILGSFSAYVLNQRWGIDPILGALLVSPLFFALGGALYAVYYLSFERRGEEGLRGLAFFFGILFITEVALILGFGVDYRFVSAPYIDATVHFAGLDLAWRTLVPCLCSFVLIGALQLFMSCTYIGRAILAVSQDSLALRLMAINPSRVKLIAFSLSLATAAVAGALLIIIQPVEPSIGRDYIGRVFAIVVLGGMGSLPGTLIAAILLGVAENLTATFYGPSWAPAVSFGILLLTLAFRPAGILGRT
ncbi:MAG TPA: branched-chain amino acid ABC transporter permease [Stellaceae bacterium]|jgi:branched-chain amino acid transport system permease protein|nr:branched-chain amino acid ABC transporter permease [Stellaceae bacterium]